VTVLLRFVFQVPVGMCKKMQRHLEDTGQQLPGAPTLEVTRVPQRQALRLRLVSRLDDAGAGPVNPLGTGTEAFPHCTSLQSGDVAAAGADRHPLSCWK
jgi:hypothetical protein